MEKNKKVKAISGNRNGNPCEKRRKGVTKRCCFRLYISNIHLKLYEQGQCYFITFLKPCCQFRRGNILISKLYNSLRSLQMI